MGIVKKILAYGFGESPLLRKHVDEPEASARLRGIVVCLDDSGFIKGAMHPGLLGAIGELRGHLKQLGLSLDEARELVGSDTVWMEAPAPLVSRPPSVVRPVARPRARRAHTTTIAVLDAAETPSGPDDEPAPSPASLLGDWSQLPPILRVPHLARLFDVSEATARRHLVAGDYGPSFKLGRSWQIRTEDLRAHLAELAGAPRGLTSRAIVGVAPYASVLE